MPRRSDFSTREERRQHILKIASELILRWGYKKTTIDDIARYVNVAKGTIYLHWKTREELFEDLIMHEWLLVVKNFRDRLSEDPEGATLSNLLKVAALMTFERPLLKALLAGDSEILGDLAHSATGEEVVRMRIDHARLLMQIQREQGLIRTDLDLDTQLKMLAAVGMGYFTIDQFLPEQYQFSPGELAECMAETIARTFSPPEPPHPQAVREATAQYIQISQQLIDAVEQLYRKEQES